VNGIAGSGGSLESAGPLIVDGHVLVNSGYLFGGRMPGNVLLVFSVGGK
jgi:polyvinyl alcohol dehydrogenase (cytochrome)